MLILESEVINVNADLVLYFFAGMFGFNSLPHLIPGIIGNKHMTPFGKNSSATMNVLWGFLSLAVSVFLLNYTQDGIRFPSEMSTVAVFLLGGLIMSLLDSNLFSNPDAKMPWWKN